MSVSYPKRGSVSRFVLLAMGSVRSYFALGSLIEWLCAAKHVVPVKTANRLVPQSKRITLAANFRDLEHVSPNVKPTCLLHQFQGFGNYLSTVVVSAIEEFYSS